MRNLHAFGQNFAKPIPRQLVSDQDFAEQRNGKTGDRAAHKGLSGLV